MMKFTVTEAEAREMARFEEEVGCDISAGRDYGSHLDKVMEVALHQVDREKIMELLHDQLGNVLSREELKEVVSALQAQIQQRVVEKISLRKSA
jgi:hypothetical protein